MILQESRMDIFGEKVNTASPICVGVLGKTERATQTRLYDDVLHPLLSIWGRLPDKMLVSTDGMSSTLIEIWAERNEIECQAIVADFRQLGRRAGFLRDARIIKESTHLLVFLGTRSTKNQEIAEKEAKKGKIVYTVHPTTYEVCELVTE